MCYKTSSKAAIYENLQKLRTKIFQFFYYRKQINNTHSKSGSNICTIDNLKELSEKENIPMEGKQKYKETDCVVTQDEDWMQLRNSTFVLEKVHNLVQVFQERAEKIKERINQPPTPSPTPPLTRSTGEHQSQDGSRPRLQSLFQQDDDDDLNEANKKGYFQFGCCKIRKSYIPTFPSVLDPQSKIYISWLFIVMLSYVYNAWVIILRAVFPYQTPETLPIFLMFDYVADLVYVIDIALFKVRLQFLHDGFWVDDPERTRQYYFKKVMFKMDLLSLLPLDLLFFVYGVNPLFRLPRLLKTQTFWEFFHRVDAVAKTPYVIRIIRTLLYMMYLIHLNACAYYAMSTWEGIKSNGWVFQGEGNAYIRCFYFATKTATSIGKNPKPENEFEYVFMTLSWLMGVFIFAFLIGQIRDIVATATQSKTQYRQLMDQTVMYMRNLNLPDDLQRRVRLWLNHTWEQQKTLNEGGILDSLPRKMKTDVAINVHYNTLVKVQLFKDCDKALLRDLVLQLKPVLFLPGDYICRKGEVGKEMYILNKGLVQVTDGEHGEIVLATLSEGSVFGEISLLGIAGCSRRTADVRSQGFSNLFVLSKDDLWEALKNYPEAQKVLKKKAKILIKENLARDKASKPKEDSLVIINHGTRRPSTPQLLKTVLQVLPKDSKCNQMLVGKSCEKLTSDDSVLSMSTTVRKGGPTRKSLDCKRNLKDELHFENECRNKVTLCGSKPSSANISKAMDESLFECRSAAKELNSQDCIEHKLQKHRSEDKPMDILKTIRDLLPSDFCKKRLNTVHPSEEKFKDNTDCCQKANSSEDSGISIDLKLGLKNIHLAKSQRNNSMDDSEDTSELSTLSSIKAKVINQDDSCKETSPSPSVFSLHGLFRADSNRSFNDKCISEKQVDLPPEVYHRSGSLTSSSTSAGYDNLAFVPVDIFSSRRSSMFSDTSC